MNSIRLVNCRALLLAATSLAGIAAASPASAQNIALPAVAQAQDATPRPAGSEEVSGIVGTTGVNPNLPPPGGLLDNAVNITGVGQMRTITNLTTRAGFVCSGTLINPRTVITAAHCVNGQAANSYGFNTGGTPISFGFQANNLVARRLWAGFSATGQLLPADANIYQTNVGNAIFSGEHVWYDPRSQLPANANFINSDIALVTLDTPATDIPTWAMLFTPLTGPTHGVVNGYGATGTSGTSGANLGVDSRRRAAENMIDFLGSLDDRNNWLFCPGSTSCPFSALPQSLYQLDFDSPAGQAAYLPSAGRFDFDLFDGAALPNEGTTAGGDSGGPLIADQAFSKPVVVGVLSGGSRFFGPQPFSSYGTSSFYQPLFLYWDLIVANNPYKYVTNLSGSRDWTDAAHWLQTMDPNYVVERDGQLVNALPGSLGLETGTNTTKFGKVCFLDDCLDITQTGPENAGSGAGLVVPGGPGSINFVPNNVRANPQLGIAPRYYDVTLSASGTTTASTNIEIDRLTINGATKLDVVSTGNLRVLGDFTQLSGWTNVNGSLKTGEAMIATGLLTGTGTFNPTFLTVVGGIVAPGGGDRVGTLTIQGDVILASASSLFVDVRRGSADRLTVTGDAQNTGILALSGGAIVFNKVTDAPAPRHGDSYTIASAAGGVVGTFGQTYTFQGVLRPELTYGTNSITALLRAGSLVTILDGQNATAIAFATALDALRSTSYNQLYNLYGAIDWMGGAQLSASLAGLSPQIIGETQQLQDRQSKTLMSTIGDRLSLLGTGRAIGLSMSSAGPLALLSGNPAGTSASQRLGLTSTGTGSTIVPIAGGITGFVTGGFDQAQASYGDQDPERAGQRGSHGGFGLEMKVSDKASIGTAVGFAKGRSNANADSSVSRMQQAAAYGAYSIGDGAYVGAVLAAETASADLNRIGHDGVSALSLSGATRSVRYSAMAEAGWRKAIGSGLALTPRAQLSYSHYALGGFGEKGGETALQLDSLKVNRLDARVGLKLDGTAKFGAWSFRPQIQADYVRLIQGGDNGAMVRFAAAPDLAFALPLTSGGSSWSEVKGGFEMSRGAFTLGLNGQATVGDAPLADQRGAVDLTFRF